MTTQVLYLIHFKEPYRHARHYLGFTRFGDALRRFRQHAEGKGGPLTRAVFAAGIEMVLAATWEGDRSLERAWKRSSHISRRCPVCMAKWRADAEQLAQADANARK